jgi:TonB family protein
MNKLSILFATFVVFCSFQTIYAQNEKRAKISQGGVCNGSATYLPKPEYPEEAKSQDIKGTVSVQILIDKNGNVESAKGLSNHPLLRKEAEKAALKAKFRQAFSDGKPTIVGCVLVYFFNPKDSEKPENKNEEQNGVTKEIPKICTGGVRNSVATYFPQPEYPKEAKEQNISGSVSVKVSIDEEGNVTEAKACLGHPLLHLEAEKAAMKAKFKPTKLSGVAVKVSGIIVYNFKVEDEIESIKEVEGTKKPIIIGHSAPNTKPIFAPQPEYPAAAKLVGVTGEVGVEILIDEKGNVEEAKAVSGHPLLRISAEKAAKLAKFKPTTLSGTPVKVKGFIVYKFY